MWKPFAQALGWPKTKIGWTDDHRAGHFQPRLGGCGHPEYGSFKLGHTNPGFSTSGLSAVASEYYAATGKRSGLSLADVRRPDVRAAVRRIERSIVHYGETANDLIEKMDLYGQPYAHAVYVAGDDSSRAKASRLVRIRPADGTFVADYPLIALEAPWVSANARAAAQAFRRWLRPEDHGQERGRERLRHPSPDRPRRARAAGAGGARRDPGARGTKTGRPRISCSSWTRRRRWRRAGASRPPSRGCSRSWTSSRRRIGSRSSPPATR